MEQDATITFQPMDQFQVQIVESSIPGELMLILMLFLGCLSLIVPVIFAIWAGRRANSRWVYLWGTLVAVVLVISLGVAQNLILHLSPRFALTIMETFVSWFPVETICHLGC